MTTTIVVGAGSTGALVAGRLAADPTQNVVVLESGPDLPASDLPERLRDADAFDPGLFGYDWGLVCESIEPARSRPPLPYPRGRLTGGSAAVNGAVAQRGTRGDFLAWVTAGNDEWDWDRVDDDYRRLERELPVSPSRAVCSPFVQAFERAALAAGFASCEDSNAPDATGVGPFPRNLAGKHRASSAAVYLEPMRGRPNLEIRPGRTVDRVLLERTRAVGVEARDDAGTTSTIEGDQVVLCAGFAKSPQILLLSGIGPAAELAQHGIETRLDLPVGRSLCDHPAFNFFGFATDGSEDQLGPRVQLRCRSAHGVGNDLLLIPALVNPRALGIEPPPGVDFMAMLSAAVARPSSRGSLRLASADPVEQPEIRLNLLGDQGDLEKAREAVRLACRLLTDGPVAGQIGTMLTELPELADELRLDEWMRANVTTAMHGAGTCPMGPAGSEAAVVGQDLAVHGTERLYVADASVMPELTTGAVNLTCMLIGERMARALRAV